MKNSISFALLLFLLTNECFSQLDTSKSIPFLTQFYDYVTNGNNLRKLWVLGDTVIVGCDFTDSLNCQLSSARRTKYQVSYNDGVTWDNWAIPVANWYTAYPDIVPVMSTGFRSISITGRGQLTGGAYAATDIILGAGSFTYTTLPNLGSNGAIVSSPLSSNVIACAHTRNDSLFFRTYNINNYTFSPNPVFISLLPVNSRYYITSSSSGTNVFVMWWEASVNLLKGKESTNGGLSFGAAVTILSSSVNIEGDLVTSWFPADVIYKPNTNLPCVAVSTLGTGSILNGEGSKVLFWSPAVNGGLPVKIADYHNMPGTFISNPSYFNEHVHDIQAGMTPLSHPSIAFSADGTIISCVFSVVREQISYYYFHYNNIYFSCSSNGGANWTDPRPIGCIVPIPPLCTDCDEIYPSLSKTGNLPNEFHVTYSLSSCPGSTSFIDVTTPRCKVFQVYRKYCPLTLSSVRPVSSELPIAFSLGQNFPNPFNPNTRIMFAVPIEAFVKLIIYDALGREAELIVYEQLKPGIYEVNWDAENFSSGIYYYSITAGDFTQTKKMVYLK